MLIKARNQFKERSTATNVQIDIPVPSDATKSGQQRDLHYILLNMLQDPSLEYMLREEFRLPRVTSEDATPDRKAPIRVKFDIPYFTISGIQVRYLKVIEKSGYQTIPWVRYITMAGEYEIRIT